MIRITPTAAKKMMDSYSKVYAPKEEPQVESEPTEEPATEPEASTEE